MRPVIVVVCPLGPAFRWAVAQLLPHLQRKTMITRPVDAFEAFFCQKPESIARRERQNALFRVSAARESLHRGWDHVLTGPVYLMHRRQHPLMRELVERLQREIVVRRNGQVKGVLLPGSLEYVVPCPPGEITLERVVRQIAGQANFQKSYDHLTPSQGSEAAGMISGGWPLGLVRTAMHTLGRWMWFRLAGLADCEPWEITEQHWADLEKAEPWREQVEREEKRRQKAEREARKPVQGVLF